MPDVVAQTNRPRRCIPISCFEACFLGTPDLTTDDVELLVGESAAPDMTDGFLEVYAGIVGCGIVEGGGGSICG